MDDRDRWKNRRAMAWLSLLGGLGFPVLLLATESPQLGMVATPFRVRGEQPSPRYSGTRKSSR